MSSSQEFQRARSLPGRRPFQIAVLFTVLHYLALIATVTFGVILAMNPSLETLYPVVAGMVASLLTWLLAYLKRRSVRCPLCKGTPLLNTRASTHSRAKRIFPFTYGTTAVLSIVFTHRFRCMYCGTPYDLLKTPSFHRSGH